jgi:hypothetical protein
VCYERCNTVTGLDISQLAGFIQVVDMIHKRIAFVPVPIARLLNNVQRINNESFAAIPASTLVGSRVSCVQDLCWHVKVSEMLLRLTMLAVFAYGKLIW